MLNFLLIIIGITFFASAFILSKYMKFAMFMIERKDRVKDIEPRMIQFDQLGSFKKVQKNRKSDIVIDIPVHEVTVIKRE